MLEQETLLWRLDVETALTALDGAATGRLVIYESLCRDPLGQARAVFDHLELEFADATRSFLKALLSEGAAAGKPGAGKAMGKSYFSVFRDPASSIDKWRKQMSEVDQRRVRALLEDSEPIQAVARDAQWW